MDPLRRDVKLPSIPSGDAHVQANRRLMPRLTSAKTNSTEVRRFMGTVSTTTGGAGVLSSESLRQQSPY